MELKKNHPSNISYFEVHVSYVVNSPPCSEGISLRLYSISYYHLRHLILFLYVPVLKKLISLSFNFSPNIFTNDTNVGVSKRQVTRKTRLVLEWFCGGYPGIRVHLIAL